MVGAIAIHAGIFFALTETLAFLNRLYPFNQIPGPSWPVPIAHPSAHVARFIYLDV